MAIIVSNDFCSVLDAAITVNAEESGYPKINLMNRMKLNRTWRHTGVNTNIVAVQIDLGASTSLAAVFLNHINMDAVVITGADNSGNLLSGSEYTTGELTVSINTVVNRGQIYVPLPSFNYRYLGVVIPAGAAEQGTSLSKWQISSVVPLATVHEFSKNVSWGTRYLAAAGHKDNVHETGTISRRTYGNDLRWEGRMVFGRRRGIYESDFTTLNAMPIGDTLVLYENDGNDSRAYLCLRMDPFTASQAMLGQIDVGDISFIERI